MYLYHSSRIIGFFLPVLGRVTADLPDGEFRKMVPKYSAENFPRIMDLVSKFEKIAKNHKASASQICIAWLLAQGSDIIPIPGTRTIKYLEKTVNAASIKLSERELEQLREAVDAMEIKGARYPAS